MDGIETTCPACAEYPLLVDTPRGRPAPPMPVYVVWQGSAEAVIGVFASEALARDHVVALVAAGEGQADDYHLLAFPLVYHPPVAVPRYWHRWSTHWDGVARETTGVTWDWDYGEGVPDCPLTVGQGDDRGRGRWIEVEGRDQAAVDAAYAAAWAAGAGD